MTDYKGAVQSHENIVVLSAQIAWASGAATKLAETANNQGIASVTDSGVGDITITTHDAFTELLGCMLTFETASGAAPNIQSWAVEHTPGSKTTQIKLYGGEATAGGDGVISGGLLSGPTSASTQATGAGATVWNIDVGEVVGRVDGVVGGVLAEADFVIHDTTIVDAAFTDDDPDNEIVAALYLTNTAGVFAVEAVLGAVAATGAAVAPDASAVATALAAADGYVLIGTTTLTRDGDTSVAQAIDNTVKAIAADAVATIAVADPTDCTMRVVLVMRR